MKFGENRKAFLHGMIWPLKLEALNIEISADPQLSSESEEVFVKFVEKSITCSSDAKTVASIFDLSQLEADKLCVLVKEKQQSIISTDGIQQNMILPSLQTIIKMRRKLITKENCSEAKSFAETMLLNLNELPDNLKLNLSTSDWLELMWSKDENYGEISSDNVLTIHVEGEDFKFSVDERLLHLMTELGPFIGA